jgi:hypothetical protein
MVCGSFILMMCDMRRMLSIFIVIVLITTTQLVVHAFTMHSDHMMSWCHGDECHCDHIDSECACDVDDASPDDISSCMTQHLGVVPSPVLLVTFCHSLVTPSILSPSVLYDVDMLSDGYWWIDDPWFLSQGSFHDYIEQRYGYGVVMHC